MKFKGDLKNEKSVLKWLTNDKAIMLPDQIEEVNELMLSKVKSVIKMIEHKHNSEKMIDCNDTNASFNSQLTFSYSCAKVKHVCVLLRR